MAEENVTEEKKSSKTLLFIIIGAVILLILIGVAAAVLVYSGDKKAETQNDNTANTQAKSSTHSTKDANLLSIGPLYAIDKPFIVNLMTQNSRRYLKTSITLELSNDKLQEEVDSKSTIIKDIIIDVLSSKSIEKIVTAKGKEAIKDEMLQRINQVLVDGSVNNIFFTEFVIQ